MTLFTPWAKPSVLPPKPPAVLDPDRSCKRRCTVCSGPDAEVYWSGGKRCWVCGTLSGVPTGPTG